MSGSSYDVLVQSFEKYSSDVKTLAPYSTFHVGKVARFSDEIERLRQDITQWGITIQQGYMPNTRETEEMNRVIEALNIVIKWSHKNFLNELPEIQRAAFLYQSPTHTSESESGNTSTVSWPSIGDGSVHSYSSESSNS